MLDLFSGAGGASAAMRGRPDWTVVRVELDPRFEAEVHADCTTWCWRGPRPDFVWASPPCTEFTLSSMPFAHPERPRRVAEALELVWSALRIVVECDPRFWVLENVRGSVPFLRPFLGDPLCWGWAWKLWGRIPSRLVLPPKQFKGAYKSSRTAAGRVQHRSPRIRSTIPLELSAAFRAAVEGADHAAPLR